MAVSCHYLSPSLIKAPVVGFMDAVILYKSLFCFIFLNVLNYLPCLSLLGQPDHLILLLLHEIILHTTRKTNMDGLSNAPTLQQNKRVEKKWILCMKFFKLESYSSNYIVKKASYLDRCAYQKSSLY